MDHFSIHFVEKQLFNSNWIIHRQQITLHKGDENLSSALVNIHIWFWVKSGDRLWWTAEQHWGQVCCSHGDAWACSSSWTCSWWWACSRPLDSLTHQEDASRLSVLNINCRSVRLNQHHRIRSLILLPPTAHDWSPVGVELGGASVDQTHWWPPGASSYWSKMWWSQGT